MFLGHFGIGFGAKAAAPKTSLGTLFLAAQFTDLLWPSLLLVGLEKVEIAPGITRVTPLDFTEYPITHSLIAVLMWGLPLCHRVLPDETVSERRMDLRRRRRQPLGARPADASAGPSACAGRGHAGRPRAVELAACHDDRRARHLRDRHLALCPFDQSARSSGIGGAVVAGRIPAGHLFRQYLRLSPTQYDGSGVGSHRHSGSS